MDEFILVRYLFSKPQLPWHQAMPGRRSGFIIIERCTQMSPTFIFSELEFERTSGCKQFPYMFIVMNNKLIIISENSIFYQKYMLRYFFTTIETGHNAFYITSTYLIPTCVSCSVTVIIKYEFIIIWECHISVFILWAFSRCHNIKKYILVLTLFLSETCMYSSVKGCHGCRYSSW